MHILSNTDGSALVLINELVAYTSGPVSTGMGDRQQTEASVFGLAINLSREFYGCDIPHARHTEYSAFAARVEYIIHRSRYTMLSMHD